MILKIALVLFWSTLIGFIILVYTAKKPKKHAEHRKIRYWYEPNLRFWKNIVHTFWRERGTQASARGFILISSHIRNFLYRILRTMQSGLLRLIQYVEHHEERSRKALHTQVKNTSAIMATAIQPETQHRSPRKTTGFPN